MLGAKILLFSDTPKYLCFFLIMDSLLLHGQLMVIIISKLKGLKVYSKFLCTTQTCVEIYNRYIPQKIEIILCDNAYIV